MTAAGALSNRHGDFDDSIIPHLKCDNDVCPDTWRYLSDVFTSCDDNMQIIGRQGKRPLLI